MPTVVRSTHKPTLVQSTQDHRRAEYRELNGTAVGGARL